MSTFRFQIEILLYLTSFFFEVQVTNSLKKTNENENSSMINFCMQVGKGRDVGLNQIALFEGKVAGGNGEQVLSRDVYRLGQLFDFFRMLSFFTTTVGFYFCTMVCLLSS